MFLLCEECAIKSMDLQQLSKQIDKLEAEPPFDKWHPPFCGDIDMQIKADGQWCFQGSPIGRERLVKLFAKVLIEENGEYFLKTPAEKVRIKVDEVPFIIIDWRKIDTSEGPALQVTSNLGHQAIVGSEHPIIYAEHSDEPRLYVTLHRRLKAKVHRNVYYQWIDLAEEKVVNGKEHLMLASGEQYFSLGCIE